MALDDERLRRVRELLQPDSEPVGHRLGRFTIGETLGKGGMGVVYRAFDESLKRQVAVKVLAEAFADDEERRKRFLREARAAAALSHPNIVSVHEVAEDAGRAFIVMELVEGESLRARLRGGRLPPAEALRLAGDVARALAEAHARGIIHRDVKPENVVVTVDGTAKLADFGLAKVRERADGAGAVATATADTATADTREGDIVGTPGYMSPEQATGRSVDARTDVFSFGVLLHEMLVGEAPFSAATPVESVVAIVRDDPPPPSELAPGVPAALDRVVARCLAKQPGARYDDGAALLADVEAVIEGRSTLAQARVSVSKARGARIAAGAAVTAVAIAAVAIAARSSGRDHARPVGSAPSPAASSSAGPAGWDTTAPGCKDDAARDVRAGILELREGSWSRAHERFGKALEEDPDCGQAAMRRVITGYFFDSPAALRETYRRAVKLRGSLSERDRLFLDAYEPIVGREPIDEKEHVARLVALAERRPGDAEIAGFAAFAVARGPRDWKRTITLARQALQTDPGYADAWQVLGRAQAWGLRDRVAAAASFDSCIRVSALGTDCLEERSMLHVARGECREMEATARELSARDPKAEAGYWFLGLALASLGEPRSVVDEALRQHAARVAGPDRPVRSLFDRARAAAAYGDFVEVEARLDELAPALSGETAFGLHAEWALLAASVYLETDRLDRALSVAERFAGKRRALTGNTYSYKAHIASFQTEPFLVAVRARAKRLPAAEVDRQHADWAAWAKDLRNFEVRNTWAYTTAELVETSRAATQALATMPEGLDPDTLTAAGNVAAGKVLMLAGRSEEALRFLRPAALACRALEEPFARNAARLRLGDALDATGDRAAACDAWAAVLRDWGAAKPSSRTLDEVKRRSAAAKCPEPT